METCREKMLQLMDDLLFVTHRISRDECAEPEEIAALPALASAIACIATYVEVGNED